MIFTSIFAIELYSTLKTEHPAFLGVVENKLTVSSFGIFSSKVSQFGFSAKSGFSEGVTIEKSNSMKWPNEIINTNTPAKGALVADGFLVPGKAQGAIWFLANGKAQQLTKTNSGWFYHRALEFDVNGDGVMDIVSCRAKTGVFSKTQSMLVWFDGKNNFAEKEIVAGCDVNFIFADLDKDGKEELIYSGFWSETLSIITTTTGRFDVPKDLTTTPIANDIGKAFDLQLVDLNNDGSLDLLVTNHQGSKDKVSGKVYAFTAQKTGSVAQWTWTKKILLDNIPVRNSGMNEASPGTALALPIFNNQGYPYIAVGGDGSQEALLLTPGAAPFSYESTVITQCAGTVGQLHYGELDGQTLLMVPCYDKNEIRFFKL